jgi:hypothetical protein
VTQKLRTPCKPMAIILALMLAAVLIYLALVITGVTNLCPLPTLMSFFGHLRFRQPTPEMSAWGRYH